MRLRRLQISVAVRAVDDGVELRREVNGPAAAIELKVGRIGCSIHDDVVQYA